MPKQALPFLHFTLSSVPACFHSPVSLYWACLQSALIDFCHFPLYSITYPNLNECTHIIIIAIYILHRNLKLWLLHFSSRFFVQAGYYSGWAKWCPFGPIGQKMYSTIFKRNRAYLLHTNSIQTHYITPFKSGTIFV